MIVKTVKEISEGQYKERQSLFLAYLYPVEKELEISNILKELREKHSDARHICYAYRYRDKEFYSDAKEPPGSAGLPILNTLRKYHLFHVLGVVVRYFGGTKLGLPALKKAYATAIENAILNNQIIEYEPTTLINCFVSYSQLGVLKHFLAQKQISILREDYTDASVKILVKIPYLMLDQMKDFIGKLENCCFHEVSDDLR